MKLLFVFENRVRPDTTGNYFLWAARRLGHEADHMWPDQALKQTENKWDLCFRIDDGLKELGQWNDALHPACYQMIDSHYFDREWRLPVARQFDWNFIAQKNGVDWVNENGIKNASWLPLAADEDIHTPDIDGHDRWDWSFVGNLGHSDPSKPNKRMDYLDALVRRFPNCIVSDYSVFKEMSNIYGQSRIVFNSHINNDINMRFFEALCSGALLVTESVIDNGEEDLQHWPGGGIFSYATFEDQDTLFNLMSFWLSVPEIRNRKRWAKWGREAVISAHTYQHRVKAMIQKMEEL